MATDPIQVGLDASEEFLDSIDALIKTQILASWPDRIPGVDAIARHLDSLVAQAETRIEIAQGLIRTQIDPLIQAAIPNALDFLGALTRSLDEHLTQLIGNIATTEDVLGSAIGTIKAHAPEFAQWFLSHVAGGFGEVALGVLKEMETQDGGGVNALLDHMLALPNQPEWFTQLTSGFRSRGAEWQALALPALLVGSIIGIAEALQEPFQNFTRQETYFQFPTKQTPPDTLIDLLNKGLLDSKTTYSDIRAHGFDVDPTSRMIASHQERLQPRDAAEMHFRGVIERGQALEEMHRHGLTTEYSQWMLQLAERLMPEGYIRDAYLRNLISTPDHDFALRQWGYSPERAAMMRKLYFFIPPVTDLIHMAIRNVFNDEIVARFELFGDFPEPFEVAARQQGISKEWAQKYWGAHWIVPSNIEGFEMFQRTVDKKLEEHADKITLSDGTEVYNIIGRDTLNLLLREKDVAPFYRDKLTQLAYRPITRIDIRRLNKVGLLNKAEVERSYLNLGYSHPNALKLADFVERLNATTTKDAATGLTTNLRHKIIALYVADKLSLEEVKKTLLDLNFTEAEIAVWVAEANLEHEAQYISAVEAGVGKLYVAGMISDKEATKRMQAAGVPVDAMYTLFTKWDLQIEYRGGSEHIHKHRELTKGEVLESFVDGMMDQATAETALEHLGYDKTSADAEINLALYKQLKASRRTQIEAIKAMYVNGIKELLDTSNTLDSLRVPSDQRDAYLDEWTLARETRTERIPIATLRDMVRRSGFMDDPSALAHLRRHRFTEADASLMVKFWHGG